MQTNHTQTMIAAHDLRRTFGKNIAVDNLHFEVSRGTIFGFLGPNGAGKTTTIRMLTGQIVPTSGHAVVAGCDTVRDLNTLKQRIGIVFEDQILYERLSARKNLEFACWLYNLPTSRVDEVLDLVKLRDRAKDSIKDFSNGMRQRIMIARALLHRPEVLFLDEPSRGLDPISARDVRHTIQQLSDEGMTILLTTHLMEEADQLCQQVAFIANGKIVANDTPRNFKLAYGERTMRVTLTTTNNDTTQLAEYTLGIDNPNDQQQLQQWLQQGSIRAIHTNEATLEEVFVKIVGMRPA